MRRASLPKIRHALLAAVCTVVWAGPTPASAAPPQAAADAAAVPKGHRLPTQDGRCAMWIVAEAGPQPGDRTTWSGDCRDGLGHGFGIQTWARAGAATQWYVGHVRAGRWHGRGRLHHGDAEGRPVHVVEGVFEHGVEQGLFQDLVLAHPQNGAIEKLVPPGRRVGRSAVQVQQFYTDGAAVLMCAPEADCSADMAAEGLTLRAPDPADGLNRRLALGGWRIEMRPAGLAEGDGGRSAPVAAQCLDAASVRAGREPQLGTLLFPSFSTWQAPLGEGHTCEDLSATLDGPRLSWRSQCRSPDGSRQVRFLQDVWAGEKAVRSRLETVHTQDGREVARQTREVTARWVGACTADMPRVGQLDL